MQYLGHICTETFLLFIGNSRITGCLYFYLLVWQQQHSLSPGLAVTPLSPRHREGHRG